MRVLITSGGTKVPIDDVRHIGNMSSGTFGSKIAYEALKAGHEVTFLHAKGSKTPLGLRFSEKTPKSEILKTVLRNFKDRMQMSSRLRLEEFSTFSQYETSLYHQSSFGGHDVIVLAAAVSDYDVVNKVEGKMRSKGDMAIELTPLPKLISKVRGWAPACSCTLVGFKLLVNSSKEELISAAQKSAGDNQCDMVVANDLRDIKANAHQLILVFKSSYSGRQPASACAYYELFSDPDDPNYLAREVVKAYTRIVNKKSDR